MSSSIKRQKISKDVPKGILKSKKKSEPANIIALEDSEQMDGSDDSNVDKKKAARKADKALKKAKKQLLSEEAEDPDHAAISLKESEPENEEDIKADIEAEAEVEVTKSFKDLVSSCLS